MIVTEIIAELTRNNDVFPHQAVTEALVQREAVVPELLRILEDAASDIVEVGIRKTTWVTYLPCIYWRNSVKSGLISH